MTNRALRWRLLFAGCLVLLFLTWSGIEYFSRAKPAPTFVSSNGTLIGLLFGGYIAYLFQQRSKSVDDLRRWWNEIVQAKSALYVYCDKVDPSATDYLEAFYKLSTAMDTLRLVYCNVRRTDENPRGYYPFEQVRDIVDIARSIAPERNSDLISRKSAKIAIDIVFQSLRHAIQLEAGATPPDIPVLFESKERDRYKALVLDRSSLDLERTRQENKGLV